jgi:tRNA(Ile)-lysidine synthase
LAAGSKKISDLLIDRKIPREERDRLRILASGREVLWVEGVAADVRVAKKRQDDDFYWMRQALTLAQEAADRGELPVGAVVVKEGKLIGSGANLSEATNDPSAHAEMQALRQAAQELGDWRLDACTLYVTLEPCPMCFGAILQAHLPRLVYGAVNKREGALGGVTDLREANWKRAFEVREGVLAKESSRLLSLFFERRRSK